jgi:hypothetical protein
MPDEVEDPVTNVRLHRADTPLCLAILASLLDPRQDPVAGYEPHAWGADVDWELLTTGVLSRTEVATVHIARGCAIGEPHGGLPLAVRHAVRVAIEEVTR